MQSVQCPRCGHDNPSDEKVCSICGFPITEDVFQVPTFAHQDPAKPREPDISPGRLFAGRYLVEKQLGHGGMGEVYLVRDQKINGRQIALKLISPSLSRDVEVKKRLVQEVEAAQALHHDNIVSVYHLDTFEGRDYFLMEYVPGKSLRELMVDRKWREKAFTPEEACAIVLPVLSALSHAHARGVVHRDLKPENIMVCGDLPDVRVKVLDFGLARIMDSSIQASSAVAMGTAYYMAPEQFRGGEVDARSDIFSAGVLLYELLTGEIPMARCELPSGLVRGLPESIDIVVDTALKQKKEERYHQAEQMYRALALPGNNQKAADASEASIEIFPEENEFEQKRRAEEDRRQKADPKLSMIRKRAMEAEEEGDFARSLAAWQEIAEQDHRAREEVERLENLTELVSRARAHKGRSNWSEALEAITAAEKYSPGNKELFALKSSIEKSISWHRLVKSNTQTPLAKISSNTILKVLILLASVLFIAGISYYGYSGYQAIMEALMP